MMVIPGGTALAAEGEVTFFGGGYGHGIGMSQYGAQGQALDGVDYDDILTHYYTGASVEELTTTSPGSVLLQYEEPLWVGVVQGVDELEFIPRNGDLSICHVGSGCPKTTQPADGESWMVKVTEPGTCIFERDGVQMGTPGDCWAGLTLLGSARVEIPSIGKTYGHGVMRIRPVGASGSATSFHVSFSMDLEDYVLGIAEMPSSWNADALRAQAVAARTYGVAKVHQRETGTRSGNGIDPALSQTWKDICWCHVRRSISDQAYEGWSQSQLASWASAVGDTGGEVISHPNSGYTYGGVIDAFYSSSTSGVTETNIGGFGSSSQFPYLVSVDDHWAVEPEVNNPFATWEATVSEDSLIGALSATTRSWQVSFDYLVDVEHLSGPPESWVSIVGSVGGQVQAVEAPGWWLRSVLGLRSPQITAVDPDVSGDTHGQLWQQGGSLASPIEAGDRFGAAGAVGDFDGDGRLDAAVAAPSDGIGAVAEGGLVLVLPGSAAGFTGEGDQLLHQDQPGMGDPGGAEANDRFGTTMAAGDFNGDGFDDLAVGVPDEDWSGHDNAGVVEAFYGSGTGLSPGGGPLSQGTSGIAGAVEADDRFGGALAVGDFNADGFDDLIVGSPGEAIGTKDSAGMATYIPGSPSGLDTSSSVNLHQGVAGVAGAVEPLDSFGAVLSSADVDDDGYDDLVVGSPGEAIGSSAGAGLIHVFFGGGNGVTGSRSTSVSQSTPGVPGTPEAGDGFGSALVGGDIDGDGIADIAVGVPGEGLAGVSQAGSAIVVWGQSDRNLGAALSIHQDTPGVSGAAEANDRFGSALLIADVHGDAEKDLVVGVPDEDLGSKGQAGLVHIIPSNGRGFDLAADFSVGQADLPVPHSNEAGDEFGRWLAGADLDGDGRADLLVGSPGEKLNGMDDAGLFQLADNLF